MSSSDSSAASSSFSSAASPAEASPEAAAAPPVEAAPAGTEESFSLPSAINSSAFLPSTSEINLESLSSSTSMETDSKTFLTSAADGEALPAFTNNK